MQLFKLYYPTVESSGFYVEFYFDICLTVHHCYNNVDNQLDATITSLLIRISSTCFGQFFAHPQERQTVFYSMWYNALKLLPAGSLEHGRTVSASAFQTTGRKQLECIIPHAVKHSLSLLRMGKKLLETCWDDWN